MKRRQQPIFVFEKGQPTSGFEPLTRCLQNSRSDQLSYVGITEVILASKGLNHNPFGAQDALGAAGR